MKFKQNATEVVIYRLLGFGVILLFIQATLLFIASLFIMAVGEDEVRLFAVFYIIGGAVIAAIGEYLRQVREGMVEKD